jgi:protein arginine kinase activator
MKCQICNAVEAAININGNVNGVETSLFLCHTCAEENDIGPEVLSSLSNSNFLEKYKRISELMNVIGESYDPVCENCSCTESYFNRTGRVGCLECYNHLFPPILDFLTDNNMMALHRGIAPVMNLPEALNLAINNEDYEQAVIIRDMMQSLEIKD